MQLLLTEYEPKTAIPLSQLQRDQLRRVAPSVLVMPTVGTDGCYDLTPGSFVGVVHLSDQLELLIRPKLPMDRILFLISYAVGHGRWAERSAGFAQAESLVEAIIPGYTYQLSRAIRRGVLQGYRSEEDALATLRGRWRIGDQIREHFGVVPPVEVTYDDFTEDIELNRLLRAALHRLLRLPTRDDRTRWPLRAVDAKLGNVSLIDYDPRRVPHVGFDRRTEHYRGAANLARLIISGASFDLRPGGIQASAFLIDMNKAFEDFVFIALREALGVSDKVLVQGAHGKRLFLDTNERIALKPDLSVWSGDACRFVGDVKYRRIRSEAYPNADLYQLTAYAIATGLPGGVLVYAAGDQESAVHEVVSVGKRLELLALDLREQPELILSQVSRLAARIGKSINAA
jgi:5-methylcytosine-specific restriction enzyme subunit McrC